jgi:hypothetical protein
VHPSEMSCLVNSHQFNNMHVHLQLLSKTYLVVRFI